MAQGGEPAPPAQYTITLNPSSYAPDYQADSLAYVARGYTDTSSTTFGIIRLTQGAEATTYFYYKFDTSQIPAGATIDSVACKVKYSITTVANARVATRQVQICSGTTLKGTASTPTSSSATVVNLAVGTWTRAEVDDMRIRLYAVRGSSDVTTTYNWAFYGAELTITYTY